MEESVKKTFTAHLLTLLTPERFILFIFVFVATTFTTSYHLVQASNLIKANVVKNMEQDEQLDEMDDIQRAYALDINSLNINIENIEEMLRSLGSD